MRMLITGLMLGILVWAGCGARTEGPGPPTQNVDKARTDPVAVLEERLKANGFVRKAYEGKGRVYTKQGITLADLVSVLGLQALDDFSPVPNIDMSDEEVLLFATVSDTVFCYAAVPMPRRGAVWLSDDTLSGARVCIGTSYVIIPKTLKPGMYWDWGMQRALDNAGATLVSSSYSHVGNKQGNLAHDRLSRGCVLPDGTWVQFLLEAEGKSWRVLTISVGPKGKFYKDEKERMEAEKNGQIRKVGQIELSQYKRRPDK